jgi:hypothetical protein
MLCQVSTTLSFNMIIDLALDVMTLNTSSEDVVIYYTDWEN